MKRIPVDQAAMRLQAVQVAPKLWDGAQSVSAQGTPLWTVQVLVTTAQDAKAQLMEVTVPSIKEPTITPLSTVRFEELTGRLWSKDGRSGLTFSATQVRVAGEAA